MTRQWKGGGFYVLTSQISFPPIVRRQKSFYLLCCFLLVGVGRVLGAKSDNRVVLQLPYTPQFQFAGYYAAQMKGYFQQQGLEVELRHGENSGRVIPEVLEGRAQYGVSPTTVLLERLKGAPLVAVAAVFQHSPFALATKQGAGYSTLDSLAGKRVALNSKERFPEVYAMFAAEGMRSGTFEIVPDVVGVSEVETGAAEAMIAFVTDGPYFYRLAGRPLLLIRPVDYGVDFYGDLLFTTEAEANDQPERVAAMGRAVVAGWQYAVEHPEEMIHWILANQPARPARITEDFLRFEAAETLKLINASLVAIGHMNPGRWKTIATHYVKAGLVPNAQRLEGFLFRDKTDTAVWLTWLVPILGVTLGVALLYWLANARLKKLVELRTRELQESEQRQREVFDLAPVPIVVENYEALVPELAKIRAAGITDLRAYLAERPDLMKQLHKMKRVIAVNRVALARIGFALVEETNRNLADIMTEQGYLLFIEELVALWSGVDRLTHETSYVSKSGEKLHALLNWEVNRRKDGTCDLANVRLVFTEITDRKLAESALRLSEERYRQLFELSPVAMLEFDYRAVPGWFRQLRAEGVTDLAAHLAAHPELRPLVLKHSPLLQVNLATVRVSGARSKEELHQRIAEVFTPEAVEARCQNMARLWEGHDHASGEIPLRSLDGTVRHFYYFWRMPRDDGQLSFGRTQTALVEITEQHRAQTALRESEERYRSLFEATPNPMYIFDLVTLAFVAVNDAAVRKYGYTREEFLAMDIMQIRPAEEAVRLRREIPRYTDGGELVSQVWRHQLKNGTIIQVEVSTRMLTISGRRSVLVVPFDITERLSAEQALRESETRYRELFEKAPAGVYRSSPDGYFLAANPALATMLGYATPQELMDIDTSNKGASLYVQVGRRADFLANIAGSGHVENFESEVRRKDGSTIWISENVRQVRDAGGRILYHEGFVSDITPRRRLEGEMLRASKLEAVGILAGGIAHDFNNILTVVLGNITLAEMDSGAQGAVVKMLRDAKRATLRARDLTQQLLTFAKGGSPVRSAVNLAELLSESAGFALHGAKARGEFSFAPDLWPADADKGQIGQVVQNLVINSVQAMPEGGIVRVGAVNMAVPPEVAPPQLAPGRYVRISVSDTGVGIAPEHLAKIFDPYFTTKQQGSGLGLATVYSIAKKHQGHIEVESRLGCGTTFHLWLPAAPAEEVAANNRPALPAKMKARVLFMDDEPAIRNMAGMFLGRLGIDFELAADGAAAVMKYKAAQAAGLPFDLVITDLTVPGGMGGREAMEQLVAFDPKVRAIVSSGYSRDPVLANYKAHGFCGILPKPYSLDQLQEALREVVVA